MTAFNNDYVSSLTSSKPPVGTGSATLDQSSFLTPMTAQLQMQDPFSPMDTSQMVAQMATFSQVAGISEMNSSLSGISDTLKDLSGTMAGSRLSAAASWIGKYMLVDSDIATRSEERTSELQSLMRTS